MPKNTKRTLTEATGLPGLLQPTGEESSDFIGRVIDAAKQHLAADISFLAEFEGDRKIIRRVAGGAAVNLEEGTALTLEDTYCYRVVSGKLPNIIADARNDHRVKNMPITKQLRIGAYIGVPVTIPGGRIFGTLCCINHRKDATLREREVKFMQVLADLVGAQLQGEQAEKDERTRKSERIRSVIQRNRLSIVFQPIVELASGKIVGAEALSRFDAEPKRSPDVWFAEAWEVGLGIELELSAVRSAVAQRAQFPDGAYMSFNVAPETLLSSGLSEALSDVPPDRFVIELTEHMAVEKYEPLIEAIRGYRRKGFKLAMDDVGAGYAGLSQLLRIGPALVKLDLSLTRGVHADPAKQALAAAAVTFASRVGNKLVAEGIETAEDMQTLRVLGIQYGQGYYFAKPGPLPLQVRHGG
jgi:EAL domain-containing protein (putative c-di-GMP-specific phosphodiesterase class I)